MSLQLAIIMAVIIIFIGWLVKNYKQNYKDNSIYSLSDLIADLANKRQSRFEYMINNHDHYDKNISKNLLHTFLSDYDSVEKFLVKFNSLKEVRKYLRSDDYYNQSICFRLVMYGYTQFEDFLDWKKLDYYQRYSILTMQPHYKDRIKLK